MAMHISSYLQCLTLNFPAFIPVLLRCLCTVCEVTGWLVMVWSALDTCKAVSAFPEVISLIAWLDISCGEFDRMTTRGLGGGQGNT